MLFNIQDPIINRIVFYASKLFVCVAFNSETTGFWETKNLKFEASVYDNEVASV